MTVPSKFPRIRVQVFDFETIGNDESIGELVIDLKKTFKSLLSVARFDMQTRAFYFEHPNFPD